MQLPFTLMATKPRKTLRKPKRPDWVPIVVECSVLDINRALSQLSRAQIKLLAEESGVPFTTLYARSGSRDMLLSHAYAIAQHLPLVREANLPGKGEFMAWQRARRAEAVAEARVKIGARGRHG